jgi:hypothetical protein
MGRSTWPVVVAALCAWTVGLTSAAAGTARVREVELGGWSLASTDFVPRAHADQGLTTVGTGPRATLVTRGSESVPAALAKAGWTHVGDPSSRNGSVLDAYQSDRAVHAKLFTLTSPTGAVTRYRHRLVPGELANNSFTAISPDGRWFVSGEWRTVSRLLVFPFPSPGAVTNLRLAATIRLTHPMRDVQGCAFDTSTSLICSTNDPGRDLYGRARQLITVTLARPLDGGAVVGATSLLGAVPKQTACPQVGETEGIDVSGNRMTVIVTAACAHTSELFTFTRHQPDGSFTSWAALPRPAAISTAPVRPRR